MSTSATRIRAGAVALAAAGVLFLAYPALRPWHDEGIIAGATASMSSTAWVTAHFFAMLGFILIPLGLLSLRSALASTKTEPLALTAAVLAWIGSGLVLPFFRRCQRRGPAPSGAALMTARTRRLPHDRPHPPACQPAVSASGRSPAPADPPRQQPCWLARPASRAQRVRSPHIFAGRQRRYTGRPLPCRVRI